MKHGVKIFFMAIALVQISIFSCKAEKPKTERKKVSEIIFWKYDEKLSVEYLDSIDFKTALNEFYVAAVMDFSMFTSYKKENAAEGELIFYTEDCEYDESDENYRFDKFFSAIYDEDPAQNLWLSYGRTIFDIENIEEGCYFSIIIDGKIVMNGLNMIFPQGAAMTPIDFYTCPKIVWNKSDRLLLFCENLNEGDDYKPVLQDQEIIKYFKNREK